MIRPDEVPHGRIAIALSAALLVPLVTVNTTATHFARALFVVLAALALVAFVWDRARSAVAPAGIRHATTALLMTAGCLATALSTPMTVRGAERLLVWIAMAWTGTALARCGGRASRESVAVIVAVLALIALHGIAERLYLLDTLRAAARAVRPDLFEGDAAAYASSTRARSTLGQANGYAAAMIMALPLAVTVARSAPERKRLWLLPALLGAAIVASGSRGGALVGIGVAGVALSFDRSSRLWRRAGMIVVAIAIVAAVGAVAAAATAPTESFLGDAVATLRLRFDYWRTAADMLGDRFPRGVGLALYGEVEPAFRAGRAASRFAHQSYLTFLCETGGAGLLILFGVGATTWRSIKRKRKPKIAEAEFESSPAAAHVAAIAALTGLATFVLDPAGPTIFFFTVSSSVWFDVLSWSTTTILATACFWFFGRPVVATSRRDPDALTRGARLGLMALAIHSAVDFDLYLDGLIGLAALLAAVAFAEGAEERRFRPAGGVAGWLTVAIALTIAAILWHLRVAESDNVERVARERPWLSAQPRGTIATRERLEREAMRKPALLEAVIGAVDWHLANARRDDLVRADRLLRRHAAAIGHIPRVAARRALVTASLQHVDSVPHAILSRRIVERLRRWR